MKYLIFPEFQSLSDNSRSVGSELMLEAGVLELEAMSPVLGCDGLLVDILASLLALMVAESTVFCLLKLDVVVWLLLVDIGTAEGGPRNKYLHHNWFIKP